MNRNLSPKSLCLDSYWVMDGGVNGGVDQAVDDTVGRVVFVAVFETMWQASWGAFHFGSPHPNLERFVGELHQIRGSAP